METINISVEQSAQNFRAYDDDAIRKSLVDLNENWDQLITFLNRKHDFTSDQSTLTVTALEDGDVSTGIQMSVTGAVVGEDGHMYLTDGKYAFSFARAVEVARDGLLMVARERGLIA